MLVLEKHQDDPSVEEIGDALLIPPIRIADRLPRRMYRKRQADRIWSPGRFGLRGVEAKPAVRNCDVLCLYWVNGGFLSVSGIDRLLRLEKPVVWRLSDFWPLTGGCHHPGDCEAYLTACGRCPQLGSHCAYDLAARQWHQKESWPKERLTVVAPSRWLADLAAESGLFCGTRIEHIPTGVDLDLFNPVRKDDARLALGLPQDRQLLLFGANNATSNPRKGFNKLVEALCMLTDQGQPGDMDLLIFGSDRKPDLPLDIRIHDRGVIADEGLKATLFAAADLFVTPSLEENLPNTVMEAMASGTPAVAFDVGGTRELIDHGQNGYLASAGDSRALAAGIVFVSEAVRSDPSIGDRAREAMIATHDQRKAANRYIRLFEELSGVVND